MTSSFTITDLRDNTVLQAGNRGIELNGITYDADPNTLGFQTVSGGTTIVGSDTNRITQLGVNLSANAEGILVFDSLTVFTDGAAGVDYFAFAEGIDLTINGGLIDVLNGSSFNPAISYENGGGSLTLNDLTLNTNNDADGRAIRLRNQSAVNVMNLNGSGNVVSNNNDFKSVVDDGGGFNGTIDFTVNGGADQLP